MSIGTVAREELREDLEGNDWVAPPAPESLLQEKDRLDEAQSIAQTLDGMDESLQGAYVQGKALSDEEAGALSLVTENFKKRLGDESLTMSLEHFGEDRLSGTRDLMAANRQLSRNIKQNLVLAREGFFKRVGNSFRVMLTSSNRLRKMAMKYSRDFDTHGPVEADISEPGWGGDLNPHSRMRVTCSEVLQRIRSMHLEKDAVFFKKLDKVYDLVGRVVSHPHNLPEAQFREIEKLTQELVDEVEKMHSFIPQVQRGGKDADFEPLDQREKNQLVQDIQRLIDSEEIDDASRQYSELDAVISRGFNHVEMGEDDEGNDQLVEVANAGAAFLDRVAGPISEVYNSLYEIWHYRLRLSHSAVRYIQGSTNYPSRRRQGADEAPKGVGNTLREMGRELANSMKANPAKF